MPRSLLARLAWAGVPAGAALLLAGCGKDVTKPRLQSYPPDTEITFAPVQYDTVSFRAHFYWMGHDIDGRVVAYRWIVDPSEAAAKLPKTWASTTVTDTTLVLPVDPDSLDEKHLFMVAAVDDNGLIDPTPAKRYFTATTRPPTSRIEQGPAGSGSIAWHDFTIEMSGIDPDGSETGEPAPVYSFQYLLLRLGTTADTTGFPPLWHQPLPADYDPVYFTDLIARASGDTLPYPHGDWRWTGGRGTSIPFRNIPAGAYVFVLRAVDIAGAVETGIVADPVAVGNHLRYFIVPASGSGVFQPVIQIRSSLTNGSLRWPDSPIVVPPEPREALQLLEGMTVSFSWSGEAAGYGLEIAGYNDALDDSSGIGSRADPLLTGATLGTDRLTPGSHVYYVHCRDSGGHSTVAEIPILVVHPSFRDPGAPREILFVDDSLSPGNSTQRVGSFPSDVEETDWYLASDPSGPPGEARFPRIADAYPGVTITEWDTYYRGTTGRAAPTLSDLASASTVVWATDLSNTVGSPIALWRTLVSGWQRTLETYLRGGGTLVLTGWNLVNNSTNPSTLLVNRTRGLCGSFEPGMQQWEYTRFPRLYLGVEWVVASEDARRDLGARDFVAAYPTAEAAAFGFDTAFVDTGIAMSGAKWDTKSDLVGSISFLDTNLSPGLPRIEAWNIPDWPYYGFACIGETAFGREDPGAPIVRVIYRYHGVDVGVARNYGPSPREGRVVGVLCQSHDLGPEESSTGVYDPDRAAGRMVALDVPLYFIQNQQASDVLFNAFSYVNGSPTLP